MKIPAACTPAESISMSNYHFDPYPKDATEYTIQKNAEAARKLGIDRNNAQNDEYTLAKSRCIYPAEHVVIRQENGKEVWNSGEYDFLRQPSVPDTVHPGLWINGRCNRQAGVFEVVPGAIYQVRGLDLANLTIIRSKTGWIVQDAMTTAETARAGMALFEAALKEPVSDRVRAVILSHSHIDHYGGIGGILDASQAGPAAEGKIPVYAPAGFDEAAVREHVFAGPAMSRRSPYQTGRHLEAGARGRVSAGIGLGSAKGTYTYIPPTELIAKDCIRCIDGIQVEFQLTPDTEAPAEMNNYFADYRALWMAENGNGTLHNLYPIRGAALRDGASWAAYLMEAERRFAYRSDVVFQSHNAPHFNTEEEPQAVRDFLVGTAAVYKYTHDRALAYANRGFTAKEIAAGLDVPQSLAHNGFTRPYYGTPQINARAVYTRYLGFYNEFPTELDPLTEKEDAALFVEYAGGAEAVIERAVSDFCRGEYKKTAHAMARVVLCNPENESARFLLADAYEQLGYAAESGIWRNAYLTAAKELRQTDYPKRAAAAPLFSSVREERSAIPVPAQPVPDKGSGVSAGMTAELLLAQLGISLDYDRLGAENFCFSLTVTDEPADAAGTEPVCFDITVYGGIFLPVRVEHPGFAHFCRMTRAALKAWLSRDLASVRAQVQTDIYEKLILLQDAIQEDIYAHSIDHCRQ